MLEKLRVQDLIDHCIDQVRKSLSVRSRFEHFVFLQCLKDLENEKLEEYKEAFKLIVKN